MHALMSETAIWPDAYGSVTDCRDVFLIKLPLQPRWPRQRSKGHRHRRCIFTGWVLYHVT